MITTMITQNASVTKIDIPVNELFLNKILKAMRAADIIWDGTVNQIDQYCLKYCRMEWNRLTPKKTSRIVYIAYVC